MNLKNKIKNWPKEAWLGIFIIIVLFYFMTINNLPTNITGANFIDSNLACKWDYLADEFQVNNVLSLELDEFFYSSNPLEFIAFSHNGKIFLENNLLVFFPEKKFSTLTIIAQNEEVSCSKTIRIINV